MLQPQESPYVSKEEKLMYVATIMHCALKFLNHGG